MKYWFRPARFWTWFAAYYPVSWEGWVVTVVLAGLFVKLFILADAHSHSGSDTLIAFVPWALVIFLLFDLICFRKGEYPSWWRK